MRLPNAHRAHIPPSKVAEYLLSEVHEDGKHKATFFKRLGYSPDDPQSLIRALLLHANAHEVTRTHPSPFGRRFVIDGIMQSPDGSTAHVRSVWMIRDGEQTPRFVTAYPAKRRPE